NRRHETARAMDQPPSFERGPLTHERNDCIVADQQQDRFRGRQRFQRIRCRMAPGPLADADAEESKIMEEVASESAVADDADGWNVPYGAGGYLSHGSGPRTKNRSSTVAVVNPSAPVMILARHGLEGQEMWQAESASQGPSDQSASHRKTKLPGRLLP